VLCVIVIGLFDFSVVLGGFHPSYGFLPHLYICVRVIRMSARLLTACSSVPNVLWLSALTLGRIEPRACRSAPFNLHPQSPRTITGK
jgi:hypothetical protein